MTALELRASLGLAGIFGLRMLGMFIILPVFGLYAEHLPGGTSHTLVGLALGAYGLTQGVLQIPFGWLSDRWGRKRVIYFGLLVFAAGSFLAAAATDIWTVIAGRALQGTGAISGAVIALTADLTREEQRTKAMAIIGMSIGVTFALSLVLAPLLDRIVGVPGIFALTGVLALAAMAVVAKVIPDPQASYFHADAEARRGQFGPVIRHPELLRLNFGIFTLHMVLMAVWVVVPFALVRTGMPAAQHWQVYLGVMLGAFVLMVPAIFYAERRSRMKQVFAAAVGLMLAAQFALMSLLGSLWGIAAALLVFFVAFNVLEASLPSLISKVAPAGSKGTASGIYSSLQFFGTFLGGAVGGWLSQHHGSSAVFAFCAGLTFAWLVLALTMKAPPAVRSRIFPVPGVGREAARDLARKLSAVRGVREAVIIPEEGVAYLKVAANDWDEQRVRKLIAGEA